MPAATEGLRHPGNIDFSLAAQADAVSPIGQLAEESSDLYAADRKYIIHQSFAILFDRAAALHLLLRHPEITDMTLDIQVP